MPAKENSVIGESQNVNISKFLVIQMLQLARASQTLPAFIANFLLGLFVVMGVLSLAVVNFGFGDLTTSVINWIAKIFKITNVRYSGSIDPLEYLWVVVIFLTLSKYLFAWFLEKFFKLKLKISHKSKILLSLVLVLPSYLFLWAIMALNADGGGQGLFFLILAAMTLILNWYAMFINELIDYLIKIINKNFGKR